MILLREGDSTLDNGDMRVLPALRTTSIHTRLMWAMVLIAGIAVAISGTLLSTLQERSIHASTQAHLERVRDELIDLAYKGVDRKTQRPFATPQDLLYQHLQTQVLGHTEGAVGFVNGTPKFVPPSTDIHPEKDDELMAYVRPLVTGENIIIETVSTSTTTYKLLIAPIRKADQQGALLYVVDFGQATRDLRRAMMLYAAAAAITLALVVAAAWPLVRRLLHPIEELREAAESIDERDLTSRVPVRSADDLGALAAAFNKMLDRVESSVRAQRDLLNDVGHELRTPITVVRGHLELLDIYDSTDVEEVRELSIDELDRMAGLVNDILMLAKSGQSDFVSPVLSDVAGLTEQVFSKARALGERQWFLEGIAEGEQVLDAARITQAWLQLANNAVKYSREGSIIVLGSALSEDTLKMWVTDEGVGIAPGDIDKVRQRFSRGTNAHHHAQGSGIGLNIVESILSAHGGELEIESVLGEGSTFTMCIPVKNSVEERTQA